MPGQASPGKVVKRDLVQAGDHQGRMLGLQPGGILQPRDTQARHAARARGLDAGGSVLGDEAVCGRDAQLGGGEQEDLGVGLALPQVRPQTLALNASCRLLPSARRIGFSMALAFFDDEATAIGQPSVRSACTKRSASGNAVTLPAWISSSNRACLHSA